MRLVAFEVAFDLSVSTGVVAKNDFVYCVLVDSEVQSSVIVGSEQLIWASRYLHPFERPLYGTISDVSAACEQRLALTSA